MTVTHRDWTRRQSPQRFHSLSFTGEHLKCSQAKKVRLLRPALGRSNSGSNKQIAHWVEHQPQKLGVAGSSPALQAKNQRRHSNVQTSRDYRGSVPHHFSTVELTLNQQAHSLPQGSCKSCSQVRVRLPGPAPKTLNHRFQQAQVAQR